MSNPKKTHELIRQNEQIVKKSQKHDVNLQKNSTFYFQIGLIICLLTSYGLLELKFESNAPVDQVYIDEEIIDFIDEPTVIYDVYKPQAAQVQQKKQSTNLEEIEIIKNDVIKKKETPDIILEADLEGLEDPIDPIDLNNVVDKPSEGTNVVSFIAVEVVPIYPGCEKKNTNKERRKCMSEKITKLIQKKFDTELATELGLTGKQKIQTQFTIDENGHVTNVKTRAMHPRLEKEADRVINKIPEMTPGKQRDKNVGVIYTLPINFDIKQ